MKNSESSAKRGTVRFRGTELLRAAACWMVVAQLVGVPVTLGADDKKTPTAAAASAASDPVLKAMQNEIARETPGCGCRAECARSAGCSR